MYFFFKDRDILKKGKRKEKERKKKRIKKNGNLKASYFNLGTQYTLYRNIEYFLNSQIRMCA